MTNEEQNQPSCLGAVSGWVAVTDALVLPIRCYTLPFLCLKNIFENVCIFKIWSYICKRNQK